MAAAPPPQAQAAFERGLGLAQNQDPWGAIAAFDQAIQLAPNFALAFLERGNAFLDAGNFLGAMGDYQRAITLAPNNGNAYYNRGNLYLRQEDFYRAIDDYNRALALDPQDPEALQNRAIALASVGELEQAVTGLQAAARAFAARGDRAGVERAIAALRVLQPSASLQPAPSPT